MVCRSPDLTRWPRENAKTFFKPMRSSSPYRDGWDREEVHLGAAATVFERDQELSWDRDFRDNDSMDNLLLLQGSLVNTETTTNVYYSALAPAASYNETR